MVEEKSIREFDSMFTPASLHPDLAAYLVRGVPFGGDSTFDKLQHPLVYGVPYCSEMNNYYNQRYELLKKETATALALADIGRYVFLHERPYRLNAFCDYLDRKVVMAGVYWELLREIWEDSENIWQNLPIWKRLLRSERSHKPRFMDEDERKALKELPPKLVLYRGCTRGLNENGLSWTLNRDKAEWFSKRFLSKNPCVMTKTIRRKDAFAYLLGRGEDEIIVL